MKLHWKPSDDAEVTRMGVPLALTTYQLVNVSERRFFAYLCTQADKDGEVTGVSQEALTARFGVNRRTLTRWIDTLTRLRMLYASRVSLAELVTYTLRPPSEWITDRMTGLASSEELEAQLGPPITREQLDARKAEREAERHGTSDASNVPWNVP